MKPLSISKPRLLNRRNAVRLLAAGGIGSLLEAFWLEPARLSITRQVVTSKLLPPGLQGLRIGLLSDFHFRPDDDGELVAKAVAAINREKLDVVALAGDYLSGNPRVVPPLLEHLKYLNPAHGVFAVMGNHDGWHGDRRLIARQFEQAGISFLINQNTRFQIRGDSLAVAGSDFIWLGKPDPEKTLRGIAPSTPVLALVHEPDFFDTMISLRTLLLQVSGHTHGGQCRVPFTDYAPRKVPYGLNYNHGLFNKGGSNLFVSRGIGTVGPRVRFACPPELVILEMRPDH